MWTLYSAVNLDTNQPAPDADNAIQSPIEQLMSTEIPQGLSNNFLSPPAAKTPTTPKHRLMVEPRYSPDPSDPDYILIGEQKDKKFPLVVYLAGIKRPPGKCLIHFTKMNFNTFHLFDMNCIGFVFIRCEHCQFLFWASTSCAVCLVGDP